MLRVFALVAGLLLAGAAHAQQPLVLNGSSAAVSTSASQLQISKPQTVFGIYKGFYSTANVNGDFNSVALIGQSADWLGAVPPLASDTVLPLPLNGWHSPNNVGTGQYFDANYINGIKPWQPAGIRMVYAFPMLPDSDAVSVTATVSDGTCATTGNTVNFTAVSTSATLATIQPPQQLTGAGLTPANVTALLTSTGGVGTATIDGSPQMVGCPSGQSFTVKSTLASNALSSYNSSDMAKITAIGARIVSGNQANAIIRLGWEMNTNTFAWACSGQTAAYISLFQQEVTALRAVPGQHFLFDFNPHAGLNAVDWQTCYPGDSYVDIIGLDVDEDTRVGSGTMASTLSTLASQTDGLSAQASFAAAHSKYVSFPLIRSGYDLANQTAMTIALGATSPPATTSQTKNPGNVLSVYGATGAAMATGKAVFSVGMPIGAYVTGTYGGACDTGASCWTINSSATYIPKSYNQTATATYSWGDDPAFITGMYTNWLNPNLQGGGNVLYYIVGDNRITGEYDDKFSGEDTNFPMSSATWASLLQEPNNYPAIPSSVTGLTASLVTPSTLTANWTASSSGVPTYMRARYRALGALNWLYPTVQTLLSSSATAIALTSLNNGVLYNVGILPYNVGGSSNDAPMPMTATLASAFPGVPRSLAITTNTYTAVTLTWTAPADGGSGGIFYTPQYSTNGGASWTSFTTTTGLTQTITGVSSGASYLFRVFATTTGAGGAGPPCAPIAASW